MVPTCEDNFCARLLNRLAPDSGLLDAATDEEIWQPNLCELVIEFGASLIAEGLKQGDRILIGCALSPASCVAYLGAMYAGLVPVPLEQAVLVASARILVEETGARAVWTEKDIAPGAIELAGAIVLHGLAAAGRGERLQPAACKKGDLAVLVATSGSTGVPRFVMVSHENLIANTEAIIRSQRLCHNERAMLVLPLSYCFGASVVHSHLYQGGSVVFDRRFMFPDKVLRDIGRYQCTTFAGVPTVYNILLRRSNISSISMPTLKRFLQAGGPLAPERVAEMRQAVPNAEFFVMYGQTEATARISSFDPRGTDEKLGSVGRPLDNLTVQILDDEGSELPVGTVGEIVVEGPSVTMGYLNDTAERDRVFHDGKLRTGDLGHLDADGYLWIDGRKGAFLKMCGVRVSFSEVEARVAAIPGVYECAASAVSHVETGEALALNIVPEKQAPDLIERVRRSLPASWKCESIQIVSEIPKTPRGKVSRVSSTAMVTGAHV